jgi:hypothetical protein
LRDRVTVEALPLKLDRWLAAGVISGSALLLVAAFGFKHVPNYMPPDFDDIQYTKGRLFCSSYRPSRGRSSGFRIDDVHYLGGGGCSLAEHGVQGPLVEANWVYLPGPQRRRLLLSVKKLPTGEVVVYSRRADLELWLRKDAERDPYVWAKLSAALVGVVLVGVSLAKAHLRAAAARSSAPPPSSEGNP